MVGQAAEACSGVLQLDPSHEGVLLLRARTLQALKEFKTALFDCDRLVQLKPDNATYTALQLRLRAQMVSRIISRPMVGICEILASSHTHRPHEISSVNVSDTYRLHPNPACPTPNSSTSTTVNQNYPTTIDHS